MSKRLDVLTALKLLIETAAAPADVVGLDGADDAPARVGPHGRVIVRTGDPGEPELDLSPLAYNWAHRIPVEVLAPPIDGRTAEQALDALLVKISDAIAADRTLGGRCDWLDLGSPATEDVTNDGAAAPRAAELMVTAIYVTDNPI